MAERRARRVRCAAAEGEGILVISYTGLLARRVEVYLVVGNSVE